jgi:hypothetical protein
MTHREMDRREVLAPLLAAMDGKEVPRAELVEAGRKLAGALVAHGHPVTLIGSGPCTGVWELDRLTDDEAIAWGMWVAGKARQK